MSLVVDQGRIFEGTFFDLRDAALALRKECQKRVFDFYWDRAAGITAKAIADKFGLLGEKHLSPLVKHKVRDIYSKAQDLLDDQMYESEKSDLRAYSDLDLTYSFSAIPLKRSLQNILIVPFIQNKKLYKGLNIGREYGYWDNVDEDENVSQKEWNARKRDWEYAYEGNYTHAEAGFSFEVMNHLTIRFALIFKGEGTKDINKERRRRTNLVKNAIVDLKLSVAEVEHKLGKPLYDALYEDPT